MFRRKRASSNPARPGTATPNAAAQLAASQAFLANRASNASLSASAAAAALRSHTTSPIPVGHIQTKRMQRRGSITPTDNALVRPGGLRRRGSSGSMTDRTFREPSPNRLERPASSHGPYLPNDEDTPPPVPALPQRYVSPPPLLEISGRRAASVDPPERISSPSPRVQGGRGVSLERGPGASYTLRRPKPRLPSLDAVGEARQAANRASVNFSRPMSPQHVSPSVSPVAAGRVPRPQAQLNDTGGLTPGKARDIVKPLDETAVRPANKKMKALAGERDEDSCLGKSSFDVYPQSTAVCGIPTQNRKPTSIQSSLADVGANLGGGPALAQAKNKKVKKATTAQFQEGNEGFGNAYPSDTDSVASEVSSTTDRPRKYNTRVAGILAKQPSIVREDREGEEKAEYKTSGSKERTQVPLNAPASGASDNSYKLISAERQHTPSVSQTDAPEADNSRSLDIPNPTRSASLSPARAAHFSTQPTYETHYGVKHQPPARSASPAKSALKNSPSRGHSPAINRSRGLVPSEASDTASGISDDGSASGRGKRKSVRVSFEEDSVVIGRAASLASSDSPVVLSPQIKPRTRSWLGMVRDKRVLSDGPGHNQEDNTIKPTPTLPSFGSIRGGNQNLPLPKAEADAVGDMDTENDVRHGMGSSTDQAIGQLLHQDAKAEGEKGSPVQVPSALAYPTPIDPPRVNGIGHCSGQGEHGGKMEPLTPLGDARMSRLQSVTPVTDVRENLHVDEPQIEEPTGNVPSIAVMPATPGTEESLPADDDWLGMPGGFPGMVEEPVQEQASPGTASESALGDPSEAPPVTVQPLRARSPSLPSSPIIKPSAVGLVEPEPETVATQHETTLPQAGSVSDLPRTRIDSYDGEESDDDDTIYSDAAEDQSDLEGDGFGSINAIVESPVTPNFGPDGMSPPASPTSITPKETHQQNNSETSPSMSEEGWDRAQAYWSGLSHTRRQELEQAALPGPVDEQIVDEGKMGGKDSVAKKKSRATKSMPRADYNEPISPPWPDRQYRNGVVRSPSTRAPNSEQTLPNPQKSSSSKPFLRGSMRDDKPLEHATKRNTKTQRSLQINAPEHKATLRKKTRPVSAVPMVDYNKAQAASGQNSARAVSATAPVANSTPTTSKTKKTTYAVKPRLGHIKSGGSDSDSSFKRNRSSSADPSKYQMKRTMRGASGGSRNLWEPVNRGISINTRRMSADSTVRKPFSSIGVGGPRIRTSMRDSSDTSQSARMTLRNSMDSGKARRTKSPTRFGFSLGSKSGPIEPKAVPKPASSYRSRFGDSSDDEDIPPAVSSSRFADSSDEDKPVLAPVRGIPRRTEEGDSTELEDSSAENVDAPTSGKPNGTIPTTTGPLSMELEGLALASDTVRVPLRETAGAAGKTAGSQVKEAAEEDDKEDVKKEKRKKRSFFGPLGSRKKGEPLTVPKHDLGHGTRTNDPHAEGKAERSLGNSIRRTDENIPGRGLTANTAAATSGVVSHASTAPSIPKSPKLQRRNTPKRLTSTSDTAWPIPQSSGGPTAVTPDSRPWTSDSAGANSLGAKPDMETRRTTLQSADMTSSTTAVAMETNGRKKKFPLLRKAFGFP
ncbi:MAG: hypothetical protein Q9163_006157 [Psora crenata]